MTKHSVRPAPEPAATPTESKPSPAQQLLASYQQKMAARDSEAARVIAEQLIALEPAQARHYIRLGQCHIDLREQEQALAAYQQALQLAHQRPLAELIANIQQRLLAALPCPAKGRPTGPMDTHYQLIGGRINLGMLVHQHADQDYLTKIERNSVSARKESFFYRELAAHFPELKHAAPAFMDVVQFDDIQYLTLERVNFAERNKDFQQICHLSQQITTVPYHPSLYQYALPQTSPKITVRSQSAVRFFGAIHTKTGTEHLFDSLLNYCHQHQYDSKTCRLINRLRTGILNKQLFGHLHPEKHYALLHGDFKKENIGLNEKEQALVACDWGSFLVGPHFIDLAFYAYLSRTPLTEIQSRYLYRQRLSAIEMGYFWLAYLIFHIIALRSLNQPGQTENRLRRYIEPACREIRRHLQLRP